MSGWSAGCVARAACAFAGVLLLAGCAGPTPYQKRTGGEGYHDYEIQPGVHFLSFRGNGQTSRSTVMDYWEQELDAAYARWSELEAKASAAG